MTANTPEAWDERSDAPLPWSAALWSEQGQLQRFLAALKHLDLQDGDTLLDFGCGTGYLCELLPRGITYYAYDWSEGMRERVRRDYDRAWVLDEVPDMEFDHVVCIGTFNLKDGWSKGETDATLLWLWAFHARKTLVASLYRGTDPVCLSYSAKEIGAMAAILTNSFAIDCTYLVNDLMLVMKK